MKPTGTDIRQAPLSASDTQMNLPTAMTDHKVLIHPPIKANDGARVRLLWLRMTEIFGHRWISSYGADAGRGAGPTWAKGLRDLSDVQVANGLAAMVATADEWPPSLPAFRKLCLGIPSIAAVQYDLATPTRRAGASAFAALVWSLLDHYRLANASVVVADRLMRDAYHLAVDQVMRGARALP